MTATAALESVILVHGGQNPPVSLADDVAATRRVLDAQSAPVMLEGHSYGRVVSTEAGNHPEWLGSCTSRPSRRMPVNPCPL